MNVNFRSHTEGLGVPFGKSMVFYIATQVKKGLKDIKDVDITCNVGNYQESHSHLMVNFSN